MADQTILEFTRDAVSVPDESYDTVLLTHINTAIFGLYQLGAIALKTVDSTTVWSDLTFSRPSISELVKQVISLRVKYVFDSTVSQQGVIYEAYTECESRILVEMDTNPIIPTVPSP